MRRSLLLLTAASTLISASPAFADRDDRRGDRDNRHWDHRDAHAIDRQHGRYYHGSREVYYVNSPRYRYYNYGHYPYARHRWTTVEIYNVPQYDNSYYVTPNYNTEIRCTNTSNPFGMLLGAGLGGLAGSTIGHGGGRAAAIAGGAVLGGLIGDNVTRQRCTTYSFRDVPIGQPISWQAGPNEAYAVVPTREIQENGRYCREYQGYAMIGGRRSETYGQACLQPDGSWQIVS